MNIDTVAVVLATAVGPIAAVLITLWHQNRQQKRYAKERLFITLMAHRKSFPPTIEWTNALNLIDVVFVDHPKVVASWHGLYDYFYVKPLDMRQLEQKILGLLAVMAQELGYKSLQQLDLGRFYTPQAHGDQAAMNAALQSELLNFLKALQKLAAAPVAAPVVGPKPDEIRNT